MRRRQTRLPARQGKNKHRKTWYLLNAILAFIALVIGILVFESLFKDTNLISPAAWKTQTRVEYLKNELKSANIETHEIKKNNDDSYTLVLKNGGEAIISFNKDIKEQVASLQFMVARLTIEGKSFKTIDLRFSNPLIAF